MIYHDYRSKESYPVDNSVRFSPSILPNYCAILSFVLQIFLTNHSYLWFIGNFDLTIERVARLHNRFFYIFLSFFALLFFNRRNLIKKKSIYKNYYYIFRYQSRMRKKEKIINHVSYCFYLREIYGNLN